MGALASAAAHTHRVAALRLASRALTAPKSRSPAFAGPPRYPPACSSPAFPAQPSLCWTLISPFVAALVQVPPGSAAAAVEGAPLAVGDAWRPRWAGDQGDAFEPYQQLIEQYLHSTVAYHAR